MTLISLRHFAKINVIVRLQFPRNLSFPRLSPGNHDEVPKTAAQQYKNIQAAERKSPPSQIITTMQFSSAALSESDAIWPVETLWRQGTTQKRKADRAKMIRNGITLNKNHFKNEVQVTCSTCHRGAAHPSACPILTVNAGKMDHEREHQRNQRQEGLLSAHQISTNISPQPGGAEALPKSRRRFQKGTVEAAGQQTDRKNLFRKRRKNASSIYHPSFGE